MKLRRRIKGGRPYEVQPDINVTPLVDVVLVLLIIFMVVAPRLDQDIPVELPGIFNPDPDPKRAFDPIKVTIATAGEYFIEGESFDLDGATEFLTTQHNADPLRRVALKADAKLTYGDVRDIFARCQQIGFPGMSLLVGHKHRAGEEPEAAPAAAGQEEVPPAEAAPVMQPPAEGAPNEAPAAAPQDGQAQGS